ncbi:hypothetical protein IM40_00150 [Candidatus Paracaedimonas acanthamoebae]|nr:hypothetical protein IM40_00150 [Candidatus Paracaedimonas acanthamoebae]
MTTNAFQLYKQEIINSLVPKQILEEWNLQTNHKKVVMICHDQDLDRRVAQQIETLNTLGMQVLLVCLAKSSESSVEKVHDLFYIHRFGLSQIIPDCIAYWSFYKRYYYIENTIHRLNFRLRTIPFSEQDKSTPSIRTFAKKYRVTVKNLLKRSILLPVNYLYKKKVFTRLNSLLYNFHLALKYRPKGIYMPLPFDLVFYNTAKPYKANLVISYDLPSLKAGALLAEEKGVPFLYDAHEFYYEQKAFSSLQKKIMMEVEQEYIKKCSAVITINDTFAELMKKKYNISLPYIIHNVSRMSPTYKSNVLREMLNISKNDTIGLYQGGVLKNRNIKEMIRGVLALKRNDFHLVILGIYDPLFKKEIETMIRGNKNIHLLEAVSQEDLIRISSSADFGIIPYPACDFNTTYCTPNKMFEFIQAELPILYNKHLFQVKKMLSEFQECAIEADFSSAKSISRNLEKMIRLDKKQAKEALRQQKNKFSWEQESPIFINIIQTLFAQNEKNLSSFGS